MHKTSGNIFEGQLDGEMKNGYGRVIYGADVGFTYYIGIFLNDQRHGAGTMFYQDEDPKEGEWEHDEIQEFEEYDSEDERIQDKLKEKQVEEAVTPLTEDDIKALIVGKLSGAIQQVFVLKRQKI